MTRSPLSCRSSLLGFAVALGLFHITQAQAETIPLTQLVQQTHFHGIAVDPKDSSKILLATHHGFFAVEPDGTAVRLSEKRHDFMGFTPHPTDSSTLYASGHPSSGGNLGFIESNDGGKTWRQISEGVNGPVDFHQMEVSKADPRTIYGVYGDLQISRDAGRSWTIAGRVPAGIIDLATSTNDVAVLYAATRNGLLVSKDGGSSWQNAHSIKGPTTVVATSPTGDVYVFVVGSGLMKAKEPELSWTSLNNSFGQDYLLHLAFAPDNSENLYVVSHQRGVMASSDGGRTWRRFGEHRLGR